MHEAQEQPVTENGPSRKALGRGLAALIPGAHAQTSSATPAPAGPDSGLRTLPIERVHPNPTQPRKSFEPEALSELAESIGEHGILQPIVVRRDGEGYEIVAGERRWRAAAQAGLREIPALVKEYSDSKVLAVALVENIQRRDLDPLEEADAYRRLIEEHALSQADVAAAVGKSRVTVTNALRLLKLPEAVLNHLGAGRLTAGHARALMMLDSATDMERMADEAVKRKMSVREVEHRAKAMKVSAKKASAPERSKSELALENKLQQALGTKVRLHHRGGKGRIEIAFHSLEHLDAVVDKLLG